MQKFVVTALFFLFFYSESCHNHSAETASQQPGSAHETQSFFPVTDFLLGQLNEVDSMPVTPLKLITSNGKTDSVWVTRKDIRPFADPFLHPFINSANLQNLFAEKSFMDETINAVTLSYDPVKKLPRGMELTHWDVYINPQKNMVERVYLTKQKDSNGILIKQQLTWKVNKWCSIRTIMQQDALPPRVTEEKIVWNFDD